MEAPGERPWVSGTGGTVSVLYILYWTGREGMGWESADFLQSRVGIWPLSTSLLSFVQTACGELHRAFSGEGGWEGSRGRCDG